MKTLSDHFPSVKYLEIYILGYIDRETGNDESERSWSNFVAKEFLQKISINLIYWNRKSEDKIDWQDIFDFLSIFKVLREVEIWPQITEDEYSTIASIISRMRKEKGSFKYL